MIICLSVAKMYWLLMLLAVNCAGPIGENNVSIEQTELTEDKRETLAPEQPQLLSPEEAFEDYVLPELQESCGGCHVDDQAPFFASSDANTALKEITDGNKVDFTTDIAKSRLVLRLTKDNHNCPTDCQEDAKRFVEVLTLWKESKDAQLSKPEGVTTIDLDPAGGSLSYDLSNIEKISAELLAEVEPLEKGGGYLLRNLRVETSERLLVHVVKPVINGHWNALNTTFLQLKCAIEPPGGRLQGRAATTIVADNLGSSNKLAFVFKELRPAKDNDPACRDDEASVPQPTEPPPTEEERPVDQKQTDFLVTIRPIMVNSCQGASCHTTTSRSYLFNYRQAWQRRTTIDQRITSNVPSRRMPPANSGYQLTDDDRNTLIDWLVD